MVSAAQAFDYRRPLKSGKILEACHHAVREKIDHTNEDRIFANDLAAAGQLIRSKEMVRVSLEEAEKEDIDLNGEYKELFRIY